MSSSRDLPRDVGAFIRDLRRQARISLRQLADQAGVSNPYLSQIERGLRKPSAEVLAQLASALRVSTPMMYLRAGLLDAKEGQGVLASIAADPELTVPQKQSLTQIYETFRRENQRAVREAAEARALNSASGREGAGAPIGSPVEAATDTGTSENTARTEPSVTTETPTMTSETMETTETTKTTKAATAATAAGTQSGAGAASGKPRASSRKGTPRASTIRKATARAGRSTSAGKRDVADNPEED